MVPAAASMPTPPSLLPLTVIPAIDLRDGCCVRLYQGRADRQTVFSEDPVAMARHWRAQGARRLHVVDLDGAFAGHPVHAEMIGAIVRAVPEVPVQVGGGLRSAADVAACLEAGARFAILGTRATADADFVRALCRDHPGRIMVSLDARKGQVAHSGWVAGSDTAVETLAQRLGSAAPAPAAFVFTDIARDGTLKGLNLEATLALARCTEVPVIASGGVSTLEDVQELCRRRTPGIVGVISGRALYEGQLDLAAAQRYCDAC